MNRFVSKEKIQDPTVSTILKKAEIIDGSFEALSKTRKEIRKLNMEMIASCKSDSDVKWYQNLGFLKLDH